MGKEHRPARLAIHLVGGVVFLALAGCAAGTPPVAGTPVSVTSTALAPTDPPAIAPGEPEAGLAPPPSASAQATDGAVSPLPPENLSPHDMELMKQSVIADWRLSRDRRLERQTSTGTVAAQGEPAAPPPSPANEQAPPVPAPAPAQPAQSAGPIPCSMLPATATPCMRQ